jgi:hypothetical protein
MCKCCDISEKRWKEIKTLKGFDEWYEEYSMVEESRGKCVVNIPRVFLTTAIEPSLDSNFGLIAIIMLHAIPCKGAYRKSEMFTFEFAKKHMEKIKKIEKTYMSGKMQVDAKKMSMAFASVVNSLIEGSLITIRPPGFTSIKKSKARK